VPADSLSSPSAGPERCAPGQGADVDSLSIRADPRAHHIRHTGKAAVGHLHLAEPFGALERRLFLFEQKFFFFFGRKRSVHHNLNVFFRALLGAVSTSGAGACALSRACTSAGAISASSAGAGSGALSRAGACTSAGAFSRAFASGAGAFAFAGSYVNLNTFARAFVTVCSAWNPSILIRRGSGLFFLPQTVGPACVDSYFNILICFSAATNGIWTCNG
jgi:hypothetical protein